eukprot:TRINITY_DN935_c0_g1_i2.p1 TRINITY_DN935_c0_g1~~TRINITY_DN935_c0_g1_i2.p1  ORF type:complete len:532 (-),score=206.57 TRINITY_DN935_c0_g1_i2:90-1580(-)
MSKRAAAKQIDKDSYDPDSPEETGEDASEFKVASQEKLAKRVIVKAKRTVTSGSTENKMPSFGLLSAAPASTSTSETKKTETEAETKTETTEAKTETKQEEEKPAASGWGTLLIGPPGGWRCTACLITNKASLDKCAACTTPKPGSETAKPAAPAPASTSSTSDSTSSSSSSSSSGGWGSLLIGPPGGWRCGACLVTNKADATQCASCTTPKPVDKKDKDQSTTETPAAPKIGFSLPSTVSGPSFSFPAPSSGVSFTPFNPFSVTSSSASTSGSSFSAAFSSFTNFSTSFSAAASTSSATTDSAKATSKAAAAEEEGEEDAGGEEGDDEESESKSPAFAKADLQAAAASGAGGQLSEAVKDKKRETSGEEKDTVVFKTNIKLYALQEAEDKAGEEASSRPKPKKYVERGIGELKVTSFPLEEGETKLRYRLLLRQKQTNKLLLNSVLHPAVRVTQENLHIRFSTVENEKVAAYLFKVENLADATELKRLIELHSKA